MPMPAALQKKTLDVGCWVRRGRNEYLMWEREEKCSDLEQGAVKGVKTREAIAAERERVGECTEAEEVIARSEKGEGVRPLV